MQRVSLLHLTLRLPDAVVDIRLRGLTDLDQTDIGGGRIIWRPSIDARADLRLRRQDIVNRPAQSAASIERIRESM